MIKSLISNFYNFKKNTAVIWLNHLVVVYAFLIPISGRGKSAIFFMILLLFLVRANFIENIRLSLSNKVVQAMLLFFIIHLVWLFGTENTQFAKEIIKDMKYLLFPLILISFLDKRFFVRILTSFIFGMLFSECISYLIHFQVIPYRLIIFGKEVYEAAGIDDPSPFLNHARYAVFLSLTIGFLLYSLLFIKNSLLVNIFTSFFLLTASINLSLIGGRIGYIAFIVIVSFLIIKKFKYNIFKSIFSLFIVLSLALSIFYNTSDLFNKRVNLSIDSIYKITENNDYNSSIGQRLGLWIHSLEVAKDNILFGVGTGDQLDEVKALFTEKDSILIHLSHLHNEYIKTFLQFGLFGFLLYANIYYQILKYPTEDKYRKDIIILTSLAILVATLTSILGSKIYLPLFVTLIAAGISVTNTLKDDFEKVNIRTISLYIALSSGALLIAFLQ